MPLQPAAVGPNCASSTELSVILKMLCQALDIDIPQLSSSQSFCNGILVELFFLRHSLSRGNTITHILQF